RGGKGCRRLWRGFLTKGPSSLNYSAASTSTNDVVLYGAHGALLPRSVTPMTGRALPPLAPLPLLASPCSPPLARLPLLASIAGGIKTVNRGRIPRSRQFSSRHSCHLASARATIGGSPWRPRPPRGAACARPLHGARRGPAPIAGRAPMHVVMIGAGYVGLVSGACFADFGHIVTCVDKNGERIAALQGGEMPIFEPGLAELVAKNMR